MASKKRVEKKIKINKLKPFNLGLIVLFVVLAFGVYLFREAIFWKTYTNEELGFSFKYPASWYITPYSQIDEKGKVVYQWLFVDKTLIDTTNFYKEETVWQLSGVVHASISHTSLRQDQLYDLTEINENEKGLFSGSRIKDYTNDKISVGLSTFRNSVNVFDQIEKKYEFWLANRLINSFSFK